MNVLQSVLSQVQFADSGRRSEGPGVQTLNEIVSQRQDRQVTQAAPRSVVHERDLVVVQTQLRQLLLSVETVVLDRHQSITINSIKKKINFLKFYQFFFEFLKFYQFFFEFYQFYQFFFEFLKFYQFFFEFLKFYQFFF